MNGGLRVVSWLRQVESRLRSLLSRLTRHHLDRIVSPELKLRLRSVDSPEEAVAVWSAHHKELAKCRFILSQPGLSLSRVPIRREFGRARVLSLFAGGSAFLLDEVIWRQMLKSQSPRIPVDYIISFDANAASYLPKLFQGSQDVVHQDLRSLIRHFGGKLNFDILPYLHENADAITGPEYGQIFKTVVAAHRLATLDLERFAKSGELVSATTEQELARLAERELEHFNRWLTKGGLHADLRWRHQAMHAQILKISLLHIERPQREAAERNLRSFIEFQHDNLHVLMVDTFALAWEWFSGGPRSAICRRLQKNAPHPVETARNISWDLTHMLHLRQQVVFPTRTEFIIPYFLTFDQSLADLLELCAVKSCLITPESIYPLIFPQHDSEKLLGEALTRDDVWNEKYLSLRAHADRSADRGDRGRPYLNELIRELEGTLAAYGR